MELLYTLKFSRFFWSIAIGATLIMPAAAQPRGGAGIGVLTCKTSKSLSYIVGSRQNVSCSFSPSKGKSEKYVGHIRRLGLDVGARGEGVMVWAVMAPTKDYRRGDLTGRYVGVNADASLGLGAGAKVLVGKSARSLSLQPLSLSKGTGINLALGVAGLTLESSR